MAPASFSPAHFEGPTPTQGVKTMKPSRVSRIFIAVFFLFLTGFECGPEIGDLCENPFGKYGAFLSPVSHTRFSRNIALVA
ncbi:MAG TPA: hypothetical protein VN943_00575 [Candidatus Acidoferrum sp.]|nr:hypothetical protein [Candidatus Acidoferrum sp.]